MKQGFSTGFPGTPIFAEIPGVPGFTGVPETQVKRQLNSQPLQLMTYDPALMGKTYNTTPYLKLTCV